jgi:hypothetical protein
MADKGEAANYYQAPSDPPPTHHHQQTTSKEFTPGTVENSYGYTHTNNAQPTTTQYTTQPSQYTQPTPQFAQQTPQYTQQSPQQFTQQAPDYNASYSPQGYEAQGQKLDFSQAFKVDKPKWNDLWAGLLLIATFAAFVVVSAISIQGYAATKGFNGGGIYDSKYVFASAGRVMILMYMCVQQ